MEALGVEANRARSQAAVGKSVKRDAFKAGSDAASQAMSGLGGQSPDLILVFGTTGYDQEQLLQGVSAVTGDAPLSGCSGEGIVTQHGADEGSHAVTVVALKSRRAKFRTLHVGEVSKDPRAAARALAEQAENAGVDQAKLLLLFPNGVSVDCGAFLEELDRYLPPSLLVAGGTSGSMLGKTASETGTFEYHQGRVHHDSVSAVLIAGDFVPEIAVSHGCKPIGLPRTVTRAEGAHVLEIDGRPAFDVYREYLDGDPDELGTIDIFHLCVCMPLPADEQADFGKYVIRTPLAHDKETGELFFPGGGFSNGTPIQLARRDAEQIRESAEDSGRVIAEKHAGDKPFLVLQFDCAGRGRLLFGAATSEFTVAPLQAALGKDVPWIGFHTFGEIAPVKRRPYYHNYTVVVCACYDG